MLYEVRILEIALNSTAGKKWGNVAVGVKKALQGRGKGRIPGPGVYIGPSILRQTPSTGSGAGGTKALRQAQGPGTGALRALRQAQGPTGAPGTGRRSGAIGLHRVDHREDVLDGGAGLGVMTGAADVTAALAQRVEAVAGLLGHFSSGSVRQDALVLDSSVEDKVLPKPLLEPCSVYTGADVLDRVKDVNPAIYQPGDQGQDGAVCMVQDLLSVAVDQVAPVFQPALEECLPGLQRNQHGVLHAHVVADEHDIYIVTQFIQKPFEHHRLDGIYVVQRSIQEFRAGNGVHHCVLQSSHLAIDLEMRNPRPYGGEIPGARLTGQRL